MEFLAHYSGWSIDRVFQISKLSEFAGESLYRKQIPLDDYGHTKIKDVGIALESGSKGDTIKIRKVKR